MQVKSMGKKSPKDDQVVALTAEIKELKKAAAQTNSLVPDSKETQEKKKAAKWKYDKSLSSTNELTKNNKTYNWCTGPGHNGTGMWVLHKPGTCTGKSNAGNQENQKQEASSIKAIAAALKQKGNLSADEIESKLEAIVAVLES